MKFLRMAAFTLVLLWGASTGAQDPAARREPAHPRRNVEVFPAMAAKYVRFTIERTNGGQPCIDELEIYGPDEPQRNLALASGGARVTASGTLPDYSIHALSHLNDGFYGNAHSWICSTMAGWAEVELPDVARVERIVWSRDRLGKFTDRLPTVYRIEVATDRGEWTTVASSADRKPLENTGMPFGGLRTGAFAPAAGDAPSPAGPASREYVLETWRSTQGLPANSVTAIVQTPDRWLWVGTMNGLVRFDGVRFTMPPGGSALHGLRITCLHTDAAGALWVGTDGGGLVRQVEGELRAFPPAAGLPDKTVLSLARDAGGTMWVGTGAGLYEFKNGVFAKRAPGTVSRIASAGMEGGVWFIQGRTLARWAGGVVGVPDLVPERSRFSSLMAIAADGTGALWFGGANEYCAKLAAGEVTTFAEGHSIFTTPLWELLPANNGDVWLGTTGSGLGRLREGEVLTFRADDGLSSNSIAVLFEDAESNVWVGGNDGLTRIVPRRCAALTVNEGLSHSVVMGLAEDRTGRVWIGTNGGGINQWQAGRVQPYAPNYALDNEVIPALLVAQDDAVWAGTTSSGLVRMQGEETTFITTAQGLPENAVTALCEDSSGGLWVGFPNAGVARVVDGMVFVPSAVAPLQGHRITAMVVDPEGAVWFATGGQGVARLRGEQWSRWTTVEGLAGNSVRTLRMDSAGQLWVGTSNGLSRWRDGRFESFTARHGLPDEVISQILEDDRGNLWLGTNRGVTRVTRDSFDAVSTGRAPRLQVLQLDRSDGLPALECTGGFHPAGLRLQDGRLCFGTVSGLAVVDPARFTAPAPAPPVLIEEVTPAANGKGATFRFTALAFTTPHRLRFRYRLNGLEAGWTEAGTERVATYAFLPPGDFRFEVQASLDGGEWSEAGVPFQVPAPWWTNPWAVGGALLAGAGLVAAGARLITRRRLRRRMRLLEDKLALERERSRIARDIHDQLGAHLTHIALLSSGASEPLPRAARERFRAIASSSNELVQAVDAIVWAVSPRHGTLESLARYLSRFAGDFLAAANVRVRLEVPLELPQAELSPELRHNLFLAAREALNNAVRHAGASEVELAMNVVANRFSVVVKDNGRGFEPGDCSEGEGLENLHRRLADCGGTCEIASAPGRGTTVSLTIPLTFQP